jgi:hypothetical protein
LPRRPGKCDARHFDILTDTYRHGPGNISRATMDEDPKNEGDPEVIAACRDFVADSIAKTLDQLHDDLCQRFKLEYYDVGDAIVGAAIEIATRYALPPDADSTDHYAVDRKQLESVATYLFEQASAAAYWRSSLDHEADDASDEHR